MPVAGSRNASLHKKEGCHCLKWVTSGKNAKATDVEATLADVPPNCILRQKDRPENMQDLIEGLHFLFANERVNIDLVIKWMEAYPGNKQDWKKFEKIDKYRYTRNLVDDGNGKFNLMLLAWGEGMGSSIHDHADAHCCMKILDGELKETLYDWPSTGKEDKEEEEQDESKVHKRSSRILHTGEVAYINDSIGLHRVENPSDSSRAVSLHIYSPPFDECAVFYERSGRKNMVKVTFYSRFGERTPFGSGKAAVIENN